MPRSSPCRQDVRCLHGHQVFDLLERQVERGLYYAGGRFDAAKLSLSPGAMPSENVGEDEVGVGVVQHPLRVASNM